MAKCSIPSEYQSDTYGFIPTKYCLKCGDNHSNNKHCSRLVAANSCQQYTLFHANILTFLLKERNATITHISHIFLFSPSTAHMPYVNKTLTLRQYSIENGQKTLSSFLKSQINCLLGFYQTRPTKNTYKIVVKASLSRRSYLYNSILSQEFLGNIFNVGMSLIKLPKKIVNWSQFYFNQKKLPVAYTVLQNAKLRLIEVFHLLDNFVLPSKCRLVYVNTDGLILAVTEDKPSILPCINPNKLSYFVKNIYPKYFSEEKDLNSVGKLLLQTWTNNKNFCFISPNSRSYFISYNSDNDFESHYKIIKGFNKVEPDSITCNYERGFLTFQQNNSTRIINFIQQKDRKIITNNDSVPFN